MDDGTKGPLAELTQDPETTASETQPESPARPQADQTYTVLTRVDQPGSPWMTVGEVTVPPRTNRRTVLRKAIEEHPFDEGDVRMFLVLDDASSEEFTARYEVPAAELVID